jgi:formate hydrogenlyase transcriptional activator
LRRKKWKSHKGTELIPRPGAQVGASLAVRNFASPGLLGKRKGTRKASVDDNPAEDGGRNHGEFAGIIGASSGLRFVLEQARRVGPTSSSVLIEGETGVGKELIARAIHDLSPRPDCSFVKLNCAAIPSGLFESELFGHEKGAFTGAIARKVGRFDLADKGTLFLDEVGGIPLELQVKLLRVLQEQEFERLGGIHTQKVNGRLVTATNRDLTRMVLENQFRSDLYYRLIRVPPLRQRR